MSHSASIPSCDTALQYNSDVAGLGVRISFYIQVCLLVPVAQKSDADAVNAIWTLCATSLGLNISALIQVSTGNLSLLESILVTQLTLFAVFGMYTALAAYSRLHGKDIFAKIAATAQAYFSLILAVILWAEAPHIPLFHCPQSSKIKFVILFGWALPAQTSGRIVSLVFSSLTLAVYTYVTIYEFAAWVTSRATEKDISGHVKPEKNNFQSCVPDITPHFMGLLLSHIFCCLYFITTTELIIRRSDAVLSDPTWSFGQVLAMIATMPVVVVTIQRLVDSRKKPPSNNGSSLELSHMSRPGSTLSPHDNWTVADPNNPVPPSRPTSIAHSIRERATPGPGVGSTLAITEC